MLHEDLTRVIARERQQAVADGLRAHHVRPGPGMLHRVLTAGRQALGRAVARLGDRPTERPDTARADGSGSAAVRSTARVTGPVERPRLVGPPPRHSDAAHRGR